jgi:hypothetical protein
MYITEEGMQDLVGEGSMLPPGWLPLRQGYHIPSVLNG